jgi:DNA-binding transcriptional LysR family regulator
MYDILPIALRIFRPAFPKIRLNLEDIHSGHQVQALQRRKIDVGFATGRCCLSSSECSPKESDQTNGLEERAVPGSSYRFFRSCPAGGEFVAQRCGNQARLSASSRGLLRYRE